MAKETTTTTHDAYLVLAKTAHGRRYWVVTRHPDASVSPEDLCRVYGPADTPDGEAPEVTAERIADYDPDAIADRVELDDRGGWTIVVDE